MGENSCCFGKDIIRCKSLGGFEIIAYLCRRLWKMNMSKSINILDKDYIQWIKDLSSRYRRSQIKASVKVNQEMLQFYWELGKDIVEWRTFLCVS